MSVKMQPSSPEDLIKSNLDYGLERISAAQTLKGEFRASALQTAKKCLDGAYQTMAERGSADAFRLAGLLKYKIATIEQEVSSPKYQKALLSVLRVFSTFTGKTSNLSRLWML